MPGVAGATQVATGYETSCAVLTGGGVKCWSSILGAWDVQGVDDAKQVAVGFDHACAVLSSGGTKCWGENGWLQLGGLGSRPVTVGISAASQVATGTQFSCALLAAGGVNCWGARLHGELGDGNTDQETYASLPVTAAGIQSAKQVTAGGSHACALLGGGNVECWGWAPVFSAIPVNVPGLEGAIGIAAGGSHSCAVLLDESLRCWGANDSGQLGDGSTTQSGVPVQVAEATGGGSPTGGGGGVVEPPKPPDSTLGVVCSLAPGVRWAERLSQCRTSSDAARRYAPNLFFDSGEKWRRPLDVDQFLAYQVIDTFDPQLSSALGCSAPPLPCTGFGAPTQSNLGRATRLLYDKNATGPSALYVNETRSGALPYTFYDYWYFLPYNEQPFSALQGLPEVGGYTHYGDWEGVTVAVADGAKRFAWVGFAAHDAVWLYLDEVLLCADGRTGEAAHQNPCGPTSERVNVYPANGSHAAYPRRCTSKALHADGCSQNWVQRDGAPDVLPEGRSDGQRPALTNSLPVVRTLRPIPGLAPDWPSWPGLWGRSELTGPATGDPPKSPYRQPRYQNPAKPDTQDCTKRWGANGEQEFGNADYVCNAEFRGVGARASVSSAGNCAAWFGPAAVATICDPRRLGAAMADGSIGNGRVGPTIRVARRASGSEPGVAQAVGAPLTPGESLTVAGAAGHELYVRADLPGADAEAYFRALPPGESRLTLSARSGFTLTRANGKRLKPTGLRVRDTSRAPAVVKLRARRGKRGVQVTASARAPRVAIELFDRSGHRIARRLVRVRRGRVRELFSGQKAAVRVVAVSLNNSGVVGNLRSLRFGGP